MCIFHVSKLFPIKNSKLSQSSMRSMLFFYTRDVCLTSRIHRRYKRQTIGFCKLQPTVTTPNLFSMSQSVVKRCGRRRVVDSLALKSNSYSTSERNICRSYRDKGHQRLICESFGLRLWGRDPIESSLVVRLIQPAASPKPSDLFPFIASRQTRPVTQPDNHFTTCFFLSLTSPFSNFCLPIRT